MTPGNELRAIRRHDVIVAATPGRGDTTYRSDETLALVHARYPKMHLSAYRVPTPDP